MSFDVGLEARFSLRPRSPPVAPTPLASHLLSHTAHVACISGRARVVCSQAPLVLYLAWSLLCLSPYLTWQVFSLARLPMHLIVLLASMRTVTGHLARDATAHESWSTASDPDKAAAIVANLNQDGVVRHSRHLLESGYERKVSGCEDSYYGCAGNASVMCGCHAFSFCSPYCDRGGGPGSDRCWIGQELNPPGLQASDCWQHTSTKLQGPSSAAGPMPMCSSGTLTSTHGVLAAADTISTHLPARGRSGATRPPSDPTAILRLLDRVQRCSTSLNTSGEWP